MKTLLLALVAALAACESPTRPLRLDQASAHVEAGRPNILFILTDDQDAASMSAMPLARAALANEGVTLARAYTPTSLCAPNRVSILRGQYAHNHTILGNDAPDGGWAGIVSKGLEQSTVATWLHDSGYRTGFFGKYVNKYDFTVNVPTPPGWDSWLAVPTSFFPTGWNEDGVLVTGQPPLHHSDLVTERTLAFIRNGVGPWFALASYHAPHPEAYPAARHAGTFPGVQAPRGPSFNAAFATGIPTVRQQPRPLAWVLGVDSLYKRRLEVLQSVDEGVAHLVAALDSLGQLSNTLIVFTSDNGFLLGQHGEQGKNIHYEESIRVPTVIRGPGVLRGVVRQHLVGSIDLAPTIADFAGVPVPGFVDGRSIRQVLTDAAYTKDMWPRKGLLVEHWREGHVATGVRSIGYLYAEWSGGQREMYATGPDPLEMTNVATPTNYNGYREWLARLRACVGAACRAAEDTP